MATTIDPAISATDGILDTVPKPPYPHDHRLRVYNDGGCGRWDERWDSEIHALLSAGAASEEASRLGMVAERLTSALAAAQDAAEGWALHARHARMRGEPLDPVAAGKKMTAEGDVARLGGEVGDIRRRRDHLLTMGKQQTLTASRLSMRRYERAMELLQREAMPLLRPFLDLLGVAEPPAALLTTGIFAGLVHRYNLATREAGYLESQLPIGQRPPQPGPDADDHTTREG